MENSTKPPAAAGPVEPTVRPCAQVPVHPKQGRLWANVRPADAETHVPCYPMDDLFDQDALDDVLVAAREAHAALVRVRGTRAFIGAIAARDCDVAIARLEFVLGIGA